MIAAWMIFAIVVGACFGAGALAAERAASGLGRPTRFLWLAAIVASVFWPVVALAPARDGASIAGVVLMPITIGVERASALVTGSVLAHLAHALDIALLASWGTLTFVLVARLVRALHVLRRQRDTWPARRIDGVQVRLSSDVGPAVVGLDPMEIVVPEWTLALDHPLRAMVLRHEEEHRRARDPHLLLASAVLLALMPWNAALWWCVRRLRLAIELDCDARVLRAHPCPERYSLLLLTIAQRRSATNTRFVPALSEPSSNLERRIIAMRNAASRISRIHVVGFGVVAAVAIAIACSVPAPDKAAGPQAKGDLVSANGRANGVERGKPLNANQTYFSFQIEKPAMAVQGNPNPQYPPTLESARVSGEVRAQFVVDESGRVDMSTFKVLKASDPQFTDAVTSVLPKWKFTPAEVGGHPVKQLIQMPFAFKVP